MGREGMLSETSTTVITKKKFYRYSLNYNLYILHAII